MKDTLAPGRPILLETIEMKMKNVVFALTACFIAFSGPAIAEPGASEPHKDPAAGWMQPGGYIIKGNTVFAVTTSGELIVADFYDNVLITKSLTGQGQQVSELKYDGPLLDEPVIQFGSQAYMKIPQCNAEAAAVVQAIVARQAVCNVGPNSSACASATATVNAAMADYTHCMREVMH